MKVRKALVVAGGVIASSHLLMRSGVRLPVGSEDELQLRPHRCVLDLGQVVDAFDGEQITLGVRDLEDRVIFETYFNPPGAFALTLPFYFDRHGAVMDRYRSLVHFGALVGAEPNGTLERRADLINGQAFTWHLGQQDQANIRYALSTTLELAQHAGAQSVIVPTRPGVECVPNLGQYPTIRRGVLLPERCACRNFVMNTAHPQGGNLMAGDGSPHRGARVVDGSFRVLGFDNLYVADASVFPTSGCLSSFFLETTTMRTYQRHGPAQASPETFSSNGEDLTSDEPSHAHHRQRRLKRCPTSCLYLCRARKWVIVRQPGRTRRWIPSPVALMRPPAFVRKTQGKARTLRQRELYAGFIRGLHTYPRITFL